MTVWDELWDSEKELCSTAEIYLKAPQYAYVMKPWLEKVKAEGDRLQEKAEKWDKLTQPDHTKCPLYSPSDKSDESWGHCTNRPQKCENIWSLCCYHCKYQDGCETHCKRYAQTWERLNTKLEAVKTYVETLKEASQDKIEVNVSAVMVSNAILKILKGEKNEK